MIRRLIPSPTLLLASRIAKKPHVATLVQSRGLFIENKRTIRDRFEGFKERVQPRSEEKVQGRDEADAEKGSILSALTLRGVPEDAKTVGLLGLIPFITTALAPHLPLLHYLFTPEVAQTLQIGYGAVILSFLGATHWGLEMAGWGGHVPKTRFWLSVVPSLIAWTSFSFPYAGALAVQILGFNVAFLGDIFAVSEGKAPRWWLGLRAWLTAIVTATLYLSMPESEKSKERKRLALEKEKALKLQSVKDAEAKRENALREAEEAHHGALLAARKAGEEKARFEALETSKIEQERLRAAAEEKQKLDAARRAIAEKTGKPLPGEPSPQTPSNLAAAAIAATALHKEHPESLFDKAKHLAQDAVDTIKNITHTDEISNKFHEVESKISGTAPQPTDVEVARQLQAAADLFAKDKEQWLETKAQETKHLRVLEQLKTQEEEQKARVAALAKQVEQEEARLKAVAQKTVDEKKHLKTLEEFKKKEEEEKARIASLSKQVEEEEAKLKAAKAKAHEEEVKLKESLKKQALEALHKEEETEKARLDTLAKQAQEEEVKLKTAKERAQQEEAKLKAAVAKVQEEEAKLKEAIKKQEEHLKETLKKQEEVEKQRLAVLKQ